VTADQLRDVALHLIGEIAPEARRRDMSPDEPLCDALGLDSLDVLNLVIAFHDTLGVDVPVVDYPRLATLRGCVEYLDRHRPAR
jgi:acyl carrier protein